MTRPPWFRRVLAGTLSCALVAGMSVGLPAAAAAAPTSTLLFDQTFADNTADGTGAVVKPATATGQDNVACLTAAGGTTGVLQSCDDAQDADGSGALSLTKANGNEVGGVFAATSVPTAQGLDVSFTLHQWSLDNGDPADGIAFALSAVDPAAPTSPPNVGPAGGSLGYAAIPGVRGLANGYLGIGFDVYGNYSNSYFQGDGCPESQYSRPDLTKDQVVVRGPGNQGTGYCAINSTATDYSSPAVPMRGDSRGESAVPVRIVINPSDTATPTTDGLTVPADSYLVSFTPVGGQEPQQLVGQLPEMAADLVGSPSWLDGNGLPKQLAFGWVGSTGGSVDNHELSGLTVKSLSAAVPVLNVTQTSYTPGPNLTPGDPVGYLVTPGVAPGAGDDGPVTVTLTAPDGVTPLGGSGDGWTCQTPVDQKVTCTKPGPFPGGSTLSPITITGSATANVPAETVQTATVTTASSEGSQPGYSNQAPPGTNPAAPADLSVTPGLGASTGGNQVTITGSNLGGATAVLVGTQDEISTGTAQLVRPCSATVPDPCFTLDDGAIVVARWPGHDVGPVVVSVVARGTSATVGYTYYAYTAGSLAITELRFSGPAGAGDEYVELTNTTSGPLPLAGVVVQSANGLGVSIPSTAAPLPSGGSYLIAGPSYSLGAVAAADQVAEGELGSTGVRVLAPVDGGTVTTDAVGPASAAVGFHEGTPLATLTGTPADQYGWVRTQQTGAFKQTTDNAADFALVSTTGGAVGGQQSMLGSPSPTGLTAPWNRSSTVTSTLIDPSKSANVAPNRVVTKVAGTPGGKIETRRVVTNTTGRTVTALQLRLIDITQANGLTPLAGTANPPLALLRAVPPQAPTVQVNGRTVSNLTPAGPTVPGNGGGLNSTFTVPLDGGLAPGASATVALTFTASTSGTFFFRYSTEALLAAS